MADVNAVMEETLAASRVVKAFTAERYEIDLDLFGVAVARKNLSQRDPQLQFAITLFPEAQQLLELSRSSNSRAAR